MTSSRTNQICLITCLVPLPCYSFGVILFEVLNRKLMLVDEIKNDPRKDAQAYAERVAGGFRPEIPRNWPAELVELISSCWAQVMRKSGQGITLCFFWSPTGPIGQ